MSWNFVRFHEILFQTHAESFNVSILKNKKVLILKKKFLAVPPRYTQKMALAISIFQKVLDRTTSTDSLVECWNEVQILTQVFWISSLTQKILNCVEMWKVMEIERWYTLRLLVWIFKKYPLTQPSYLGLYVSTLCKSPETWQGKIGLQFFDWG